MIRIHLKSKRGIYQVVSHSWSEMVLTTNSGNKFTRPISDFKAIAGGDWNWRVPAYQIAFFKSFLPTHTLTLEEFDFATYESDNWVIDDEPFDPSQYIDYDWENDLVMPEETELDYCPCCGRPL